MSYTRRLPAIPRDSAKATHTHLRHRWALAPRPIRCHGGLAALVLGELLLSPAGHLHAREVQNEISGQSKKPETGVTDTKGGHAATPTPAKTPDPGKTPPQKNTAGTGATQASSDQNRLSTKMPDGSTVTIGANGLPTIQLPDGTTVSFDSGATVNPEPPKAPSPGKVPAKEEPTHIGLNGTIITDNINHSVTTKFTVHYGDEDKTGNLTVTNTIDPRNQTASQPSIGYIYSTKDDSKPVVHLSPPPPDTKEPIVIVRLSQTPTPLNADGTITVTPTAKIQIIDGKKKYSWNWKGGSVNFSPNSTLNANPGVQPFTLSKDQDETGQPQSQPSAPEQTNLPPNGVPAAGVVSSPYQKWSVIVLPNANGIPEITMIGLIPGGQITNVHFGSDGSGTASIMNSSGQLVEETKFSNVDRVRIGGDGLPYVDINYFLNPSNAAAGQSGTATGDVNKPGQSDAPRSEQPQPGTNPGGQGANGESGGAEHLPGNPGTGSTPSPAPTGTPASAGQPSTGAAAPPLPGTPPPPSNATGSPQPTPPPSSPLVTPDAGANPQPGSSVSGGSIIPAPPIITGASDALLGAINGLPPTHQAKQDPTDPTQAHDSTTGQNLYWVPDKKTWVDSKTGQSVGFDGVRTSDGTIIPAPPIIIGASDALLGAINGLPPTHQAKQDPTDPTQAHDSTTGQNLVWDRDKKTWIDAKTGEALGFAGGLASVGTVIATPPLNLEPTHTAANSGSATDAASPGTPTTDAIGGVPTSSDINRQTAKSLCEQAKELHDLAAADAQKSTSATDPKTRDYFAQESISEENRARQREQLANHYDPSVCPPPVTALLPGGPIVVTNTGLSSLSAGGLGTGSFLSLTFNTVGAINTALSAGAALSSQDFTVSGESIQNASLDVPGRTRVASNEPDSPRAPTAHPRARWQLAASVTSAPLSFSSWAAMRPAAEEEPAVDTSAEITYSLVANGNSSGNALELQVFDPSGRVKQAEIPEGTILEPVKLGAAKPVAERAARGANLLTKQLTAYCVDYLKLPPQVGMLYRLASQAVQDKFKPITAVLRAGRESAAKGQFHPDSDAKAYNDSIRQYALWSKLENWDEQKFGEVFLDKTKQNAVSAKVKWTKQMEQAVRGLVPGRWRDISMVLDQAAKLSSASQTAKP